jgi:DNA-3-methyladenine glycosylase
MVVAGFCAHAFMDREGIMSGDYDYLTGDADVAAQRLLGDVITRDLDGRRMRARIVETEAYDQNDRASHAFRGRDERNRALFGPPGHLYIYISYGIHRCCNITCGPDGFGAGVLIRAVEPVEGLALMEERRAVRGVAVSNGPGKLCQALGIDMRLYGHAIGDAPLTLRPAALRDGEGIVRTPRIGISKETGRLRRYLIEGNPCVSRAPVMIRRQAVAVEAPLGERG